MKVKFGNLLKEKKPKTYSYCDVTEKLMRHIDPLNYGIEKIVAGEKFRIGRFQKSEHFGKRLVKMVLLFMFF